MRLVKGARHFPVIAYGVAQRRREIGIRAALGATPSSVIRRVLRHGVGLAAIGLALGLSFALVFSQSLATLLYDVRPADPATFGGVTLVLMATAVAASAIPARRAAALDPMMV
ncbi:MAG TPA: FtsX-like permease family protein, partial [Gemmatimonadales bacterium]